MTAQKEILFYWLGGRGVPQQSSCEGNLLQEWTAGGRFTGNDPRSVDTFIALLRDVVI